MKIISNLHIEFYWVRQSSLKRIKYFVVLLTLMLGLTSKSYSKNFYFSSSAGNDSYTATQAQNPATPWKTIDKLNSSMSLINPGDYILFKRGDTFSGTITITHSGSPGRPIIISDYGTGAYPVISGFTALSGWINKSGNIWQANVSISKIDTSLNMLTINGVQYGMGRYPNSDYLSYESHIDNTTIIDNQLTGNPNWTGAEAIIKKIRFTLDRNVITNHTATTLLYATGSSWTPTDTYGYFIQNDPKTLDVFGEWYYNPSDKTLKMYSSVDPSLYNIKASVIDTLVYIDDKDYVTFENLTFEGANQYAVLNFSGRHINIQNCNINFSGIDGIFTDNASTNAIMLIDGLTINHANECAIHLRNSTTYAWIKNNTIKNIGIIPGAGTSSNNGGDGIAFYGKNTLVEFNSIDSVGHSGIRFSNCDSVQVRNNYVSNFCLVRYDGGGITSWNNPTTTTHGQKIKNNIILNGNAVSSGIGSGNDMFVHGIYLDGYSINIDMTGNTTANCPSSGIYILLSSDINITNNTSYNNGSQIKFTFNYGSQLQIRNCYVNDNIFIAKEANQLALSFYSTANDIALFGTADKNYYARPIDDNNVFFTYEPSTGSKNRTLIGWQSLTNQDLNSHKSPIPVANINDIRFEYNASKTNKVITLDKPMVDIKGIKYQNSITLLPYTSTVLMVDPNPVQPVIPVYASSAIENATPAVLEMTYDLSLANVVPAASAFAVKVNSVTRTVNSVAISGTKVLLTLSSPVSYGEFVTIAYTKPSTNPLQTSAGGQAASISTQSVTNNVVPVSPVYINSSIENATPSILGITYNLSLANVVPATSAFTVMVNSVARTVSSVAVSGTSVTLTLASAVAYGDVVTVAYTKPSSSPLQTPAGGQVVSLSDQSVSNNVQINNTPPVIIVNYQSTTYSGFVSEINASGSYDTNNDKLSFSWVIPGNIPVSSTTSSKIQYLSPIVDATQKVEFIVNVSDGKSTQLKTIPVDILPYEPGLDVAEVVKVEASGYLAPNYPYNIIDRNIGTVWAVDGDNQWLLLELKEPFSIQHVKLAFQPGKKKESYFDILGSEDMVIWEPILTKSNSCAFSGDLQVFDFPPSKTGIEFKYIKLIGHCNSLDTWNYISEFMIFGYKHKNPSTYEEQPVKIYPNPAQDFFNVKIEESSVVHDFIRIISLTGKILFQEKIDPAVNEFQVPINLLKGIYLIQLGSGYITGFSQKLVIEY